LSAVRSLGLTLAFLVFSCIAIVKGMCGPLAGLLEVQQPGEGARGVVIELRGACAAVACAVLAIFSLGSIVMVGFMKGREWLRNGSRRQVEATTGY
jgi:hypothetical protein